MFSQRSHVAVGITVFYFLLVAGTMVAAQQGTVEIARGICRSTIIQYTARCRIPALTHGLSLSVRLVRTISRNSCIENRTFGLAWDQSALWVTGLCEGEFSITITPSATNSKLRTTVSPPTSLSWETTGTTRNVEIYRTTCKSIKLSQRSWCPIPRGSDLAVRLLRQISKNRCVLGKTFGLERGKTFIWVTGLCEGLFSVMSSAINTVPSPTTSSRTNKKRPTTNKVCGATSMYRVIGGAAAGPCEYPWMVMVTNLLTNNSCGGAILDQKHIMTASHCFYSTDRKTGRLVKATPKDILVLYGSSTMSLNTSDTPGPSPQLQSVDKIIPHKNYNVRTLANDIAILKLSGTIEYNRCQLPICLPDGRKDVQQAINCRAMGWGVTSNIPGSTGQASLQWVNLPVVSNSDCKRQYQARVTDAIFCAGTVGKDTCQGDSGGPFVCQESDGRFYAYGVVSAGLEGQCGNYFGLYTKVSSYMAWIQNNIS